MQERHVWNLSERRKFAVQKQWHGEILAASEILPLASKKKRLYPFKLLHPQSVNMAVWPLLEEPEALRLQAMVQSLVTASHRNRSDKQSTDCKGCGTQHQAHIRIAMSKKEKTCKYYQGGTKGREQTQIHANRVEHIIVVSGWFGVRKAGLSSDWRKDAPYCWSTPRSMLKVQDIGHTCSAIDNYKRNSFEKHQQINRGVQPSWGGRESLLWAVGDKPQKNKIPAK